MSDDSQNQSCCAVAEALVFPRMNRIEQGLGSGQDKFMDHDIRLRAMEMRHEEHHRRITLLEGWMAEQRTESRSLWAEQQAENRGMHRDIQSLQAAVGSVVDGLGALTVEVRNNAGQSAAMFGEIKAFFSAQSIAAKKAEEREERRNKDTLKRHGALMRVGMFVAFSVAGLVAVLGALHGVFAKIPLTEAIAAMLARLSL